tara:strand:- start:470 stop:724 length:255 start_codon:yes stop_codon:yes gene_type:complete
MKTINLIFHLSVIFIISMGSYLWLSGFKSAFEADRYCHYELSIKINSEEFGCDHDTETHQWILYENEGNSNKPKIIKRYRYRFL